MHQVWQKFIDVVLLLLSFYSQPRLHDVRKTGQNIQRLQCGFKTCLFEISIITPSCCCYPNDLAQPSKTQATAVGIAVQTIAVDKRSQCFHICCWRCLARGLRCRLDGRRCTWMSCQELWKANRCRRCHRFGAILWLTGHMKGTALVVSVDIFFKLWNFRVTRQSFRHVCISWISLKTSSKGNAGVLDLINCFFSGLQLRKGHWLLVSSRLYCKALLWSSLSGFASVRAVNRCRRRSIIVTTRWCRNGVVFSLRLVQSLEAVMSSPKIDPGPGFSWTRYSMSRFRHLRLSSWRRSKVTIALRRGGEVLSSISCFGCLLPLWRFSVSWWSESR